MIWRQFVEFAHVGIAGPVDTVGIAGPVDTVGIADMGFFLFGGDWRDRLRLVSILRTTCINHGDV